MRVLHLSSGNLYGGVETYLSTLARLRHLAPEMEPEFGLCFPGRIRDELSATGVIVHDLGAVRLSRPWTVLSARRQLRDVLDSSEFDVVICHSTWPHCVFAPVVHKQVFLVHAVHGDYSTPNRLERWAARTSPDLVLANSKFTAEPAAKLFKNSPVKVVYLPVEPRDVGNRSAVRTAVRREVGTPDDAVVILQASRLEPIKGQAEHIAALGRLIELPGWEAWFAGGPQKPGEAELLSRLQQVARDLGVATRIKFLGQRSDVPRLMAAADIYCQPNIGPESFGLAFIEALFAGLPVVTSKFGGATEIVSDDCGSLVPPGDHQSLSSVLADLITDSVKRATMSENGPAHARDLCDPATVLARFARECRSATASMEVEK